MNSERDQIERTRPDFSTEAIWKARERSWSALKLIASRIEVGMREEDALQLANQTIAECGADKRWHRSYVRFGINTLQPYGTPSQPDVRLGADDIFFVDIGPVFDAYEGDVGATFVTGSDADMRRCIEDSRQIYDEVRAEWLRGETSGAALYDFAGHRAEARGWKLNLVEANGHRLSDFPHALYHRGAISDLTFKPAPYRWVLEIQIRHPERAFGAFYEDLLV